MFFQKNDRSFFPSFDYIQSHIGGRLGNGFSLISNDGENSSLRFGDSFREVLFSPFLSGFSLTDVFEGALELRMLPADDFVKEAIGETEVPALCACDAPLPPRLITVEGDMVRIHFDLLGSAFYILTRAEEYLSPVRDAHDRFPAYASHAFAHGYLHRPVVDEYVEILWRCIRRLWPGAERKGDSFRIMATHDVDAPFEHLFRPPWLAARVFAGDVLKRRDLPLAFNRVHNWFDVKYRKGWRRDPFYTFETIMDTSEDCGLESAFYFLTGGNTSMDGDYNLNQPRIAALMSRIHERGHEVGYHGSYDTFQDAAMVKEEVTKLKEEASKLGIERQRWGGRQHYLRWNAPVTWRSYAEAGLDYDATLSYADHAGFRCGTCHPFTVFDVEQNKPLGLTEYPLIVMECSVLDSRYMNLPRAEALDYMLKLKEKCRKYNGNFCILWHNTRFVEAEEVELYRQVLEG